MNALIDSKGIEREALSSNFIKRDKKVQNLEKGSTFLKSYIIDWSHQDTVLTT